MSMMRVFKSRVVEVCSVAIVFTAALVGPSSPSEAQSICVPSAVGVPALSGPPNWYDSAPGEPDYWPELDDPRWRGAFQRSEGGMSGSEHIRVRANRHGSGASAALYLSWSVKTDPTLDNAVDSVWVAFSPGGADPDVLIQVVPFNSTASTITAADPFDINYFERGAGWSQVEPPPAWTQDTKAWLEPAPSNSWAVQMKVPLVASPSGIPLPADFKLWYSVEMAVAGSAAVSYTAPAGVSFLDVFTEASLPVAWQDFNLNGSPPTSCLAGVSITSSDIGVGSAADCANPATSLSSQIELTDGGIPATNTLCARPDNGGSAAATVNARFRIANWGTQVDWNLVDDPVASLWTLVGGASCNPSLGGAVLAGAQGAVTCDWTLTNDELCKFDPALGSSCMNATPELRRHQCMLVELDGAGVDFTTSSVYRNMDFVDASVFEREADVSIAGIAALPPGETRRDVYLYVQTTNMPRRVAPSSGRPIPGQRRDPSGAAGSGVRDGDDIGENPDRPNIPPEELDPFAELRRDMPTYVVHAYRDTGERVMVSGVERARLVPQTSFGYFVRHSGPLSGWRHSLEGAEEIAPNFYRLSVSPAESETVLTRIEALEGHQGWSLGLHAGWADPDTSLLDSGPSFGVDVQYRFNSRFAVGGYLGREQLDGTGGLPDVDVDHFSLFGKAYWQTSSVEPFVVLGLGSFDPSGGSSEFGFSLGGGVAWDLNQKLGLEGTVKWHSIDFNPTLEVITAQLGLRIRF